MPDQAQEAGDIQKALALSQIIKLQMNESLLRILSDTEGENPTESTVTHGSLADRLGDLFSRGGDPFLSKVRQAPSESELSLSHVPDQRVEKTEDPHTNSFAGNEIEDIIRKAAKAYGVDSGLIRDVIQAESSFNPDAVSSKGAMGLMQLMPDTAKELGVTDPMNPLENVMGGTRYLKKLLDRYDQNVPLALAAYNWGMGNLDAHRRRMPAETKNYVAKITGIAIS
ncbi:MAG: lytic transglycosylase domain-containing protein [Proteobacteria bacterium]|nr:lytic transglycosylase domain-containing protein [Pseudomonadota bacterium]